MCFWAKETARSRITSKPRLELILSESTITDFNGDGKMDLAVANNGANTVSVLLGNGDGTFQAKKDAMTGSLPIAVAFGDFNHDGKMDLAVVNNGAAP